MKLDPCPVPNQCPWKVQPVVGMWARVVKQVSAVTFITRADALYYAKLFAHGGKYENI